MEEVRSCILGCLQYSAPIANFQTSSIPTSIFTRLPFTLVISKVDVPDAMQRLFQVFVTFTIVSVAIRAEDGVKCDFLAVIDVANEVYPGCRDLYNVLEQSMPVNFTSTLCNNSDCMVGINKLRAMDLGDCIVFGSTTLTSDILDQCKETEETSTGWVGWLFLAITLLVFIPIVIYRVKYYRQKRTEAQLDFANGKLGINDGPYQVIDLAGTRV